MGELAAFCTTLSWSIGVFPFTEASRRVGPNTVNATRLLLAVLMLTPIAVLFFPLSLSSLFTFPYPVQWLWFGLSGILGLALGDYFAFVAFAILGPKTGTIFNTLSPGAALLTGFFLLGETVNLVGVFGILITVGGILWIVLSKKNITPVRTEFGNKGKGVLFGILSALCQGVGLVLSKKAMTFDSGKHHLLAIHSIWMRMFCSVVVIYLLLFLRGQVKKIHGPVLKNHNGGLWYLIAGTFFGPVLGGCIAMYAISVINVSVAQTIFSLVPVFTLPLAWLFYGEKISLSAVTGALIAVLGVVVLIWRNSFF
jgi:drug/metabolite transporter (DMT)-like permease